RSAAAASSAALRAVVNADAYGHGLIPIARAARQAGTPWLGVATIDEAKALRRAGDQGHILCWLAAPGAAFGEAIDHGIEVTASSVAQLAEIVAAAQGRRVRVQLKVDTGLSRNGAAGAEWSALVEAAVVAQRMQSIDVTGIWSHFACSDEPDHPANAGQQQAFDAAVAFARASGLEPRVVHLSNSAALLTRPSAHYDVVRAGIATYGISPAPEVDRTFGLRPVMTLRGTLASVKRVPAGTGVSYGHTFITERETTLGLVPLGYGEGILRSASNAGPVQVGATRARIAGRVCMDQFVIDLGDSAAVVGDDAVLFGPGDRGEPTAQDWAEAAGTIAYEVVTRLGGRIVRTYRGDR
ncbi:MAG: alr, partial [Nocardioidaceae bacterium]|nr:alr [Nocardioidaceae bacterium]